MTYPSEKKFIQLTKKGNLIAVYKEILADLETPVSTYYKIAKNEKYSFLLESVEGEEKIARYSFLASDPELLVQFKKGKLTTSFVGHKKQTQKVIKTDAPLKHIRKLMTQFKFVKIPGLPRFCGGLVGYLGYDTVRYFERLPNKPKDTLNLPDICLMLAKCIIIFDHRNHKIQIVNSVYIPEGSSNNFTVKKYQESLKKIDRIIAKIKKPLSNPKLNGKTCEPIAIKSNFSRKKFESIVKQAKKEITAGEIIQVVLSQRLTTPLTIDPFQIYRVLRTLNPSPYMFYLKFGDTKLVGSSPELLVRCEEGVVETRPIAGTRPRGKTDAHDNALAKELLADKKENAEHIMLVDLGRNDLGRVCKKGTVKVTDFMFVEKYSHVMHIVSNVKGTLAHGKDSFDVLQAAFPAGTLSGAPKIRAMEIIDALENTARGPYGGCIGYFSFSGNLDSCITIRTIVVSKQKAYIQAGAGIVADSNPFKEYQETLNKAKAQIEAIKKALTQFN